MVGEVPGARVVLATHNQGKVRELRAMLAAAGLGDPELVVDAGTAGLGDVVETGVTFQQNALLKARAAAADQRSGTAACRSAAQDPSSRSRSAEGEPGSAV